MPLHDWTSLDAGTFHHFRGAWITHLSEALNRGLLPDNFYALAEQHANMRVADILTLDVGARFGGKPRETGSIATIQPPPRVSRKMELEPNAAYRRARRTITVRHTSGHRVVSMVEIVSPANKDRKASVDDFVRKAVEAIDAGVHLLVIDLLPPGLHDIQGIHGAIWAGLGSDDFSMSTDRWRTFVAYEACELPRAWLELVKVADPLPDMPLFLDISHHIAVPLEATYMEAYQGMPQFWREVIEGRTAPR